MSTFYAIDPGSVRTGVAMFAFDDETVELLSYNEVYGGLEGMLEYLDLKVPTFVTHFVVEDYIVHRTAGDPNGLRVIGAIEMWAYQHGRKPVILQPPSGRKKMVPDNLLKRLGWYLEGETLRNAREAIRHGVWWLRNQKHPHVLREIGRYDDD